MVQKSPESEMIYEKRKSLIGMRMTVLYSVIYAGFIFLSVFRPSWMGTRALFSLNLATAYGLGLILIAIIFALLYNHLCRISPSKKYPQDFNMKQGKRTQEG